MESASPQQNILINSAIKWTKKIHNIHSGMHQPEIITAEKSLELQMGCVVVAIYKPVQVEGPLKIRSVPMPANIIIPQAMSLHSMVKMMEGAGLNYLQEEGYSLIQAITLQMLPARKKQKTKVLQYHIAAGVAWNNQNVKENPEALIIVFNLTSAKKEVEKDGVLLQL
jgi:hypothetical protein